MAGNNGKMGLARWKRQRGICQNFAADVDEIMQQLSLSEGGKVAFLEPWVPPASRSALTLRPNFDILEIQPRRRSSWEISVQIGLSATSRRPGGFLLIVVPGHFRFVFDRSGLWNSVIFSAMAGVSLFLIRTSRELLVTH